jgi:hypothetical protein
VFCMTSPGSFFYLNKSPTGTSCPHSRLWKIPTDLFDKNTFMFPVKGVPMLRGTSQLHYLPDGRCVENYILMIPDSIPQ